jgi:hypothetical protein
MLFSKIRYFQYANYPLADSDNKQQVITAEILNWRNDSIKLIPKIINQNH